MKKCGIYLIRCKENKKVYVGQSINIRARIKCHFFHLSKNYHKNLGLLEDYKKFGRKSFESEIIEICERERLNEREGFYISFYKSLDKEFGFNVQKERLGQLACLSEEGKRKSSKKTHQDAEWREKKRQFALNQLKDPVYAAQNLTRLAEGRKSPKRIINLQKFNEIQRSDQEFREKQSKKLSESWGKSGKENRIASIKKSAQDPIVAQKKREAMKALWSNQEYRANNLKNSLKNLEKVNK